ncbi:MAG TPA: hypothetical protein VH110_10100 [Candidatus Acidoferrum sp.]|jgi:hypothetical protein|nr:hypothetical protein [Candidatus Acidoferrum sp.]
MKEVALGFRVHSGWTALVAVSMEKGSPAVVARQRLHLVETFTYEFRQPYHTAEKMPPGEGCQFIARVQDEARRLAYRAIQGLKSDLHKQDIKLTRCGMLLASARPLPSLERILASHALIHTADGELFREAILHAGARCSLKTASFKDKELLEHAKSVLRIQPAVLMRRVTELGRPFDSPWSQDEKFATLAAWLALKGVQTRPGRASRGASAA